MCVAYVNIVCGVYICGVVVCNIWYIGVCVCLVCGGVCVCMYVCMYVCMWCVCVGYVWCMCVWYVVGTPCDRSEKQGLRNKLVLWQLLILK